MGISSRIMKRGTHPLAPLVAIIFVSLGRLLFEIAIYDQTLRATSALRNLIITASFYTVTFFLFSVLMVFVLSKPFEKVANAVSVGILFGLVPPILDLFFASELTWRYIYFRSFTWTLFAQDQPISESIALWGVILGCGGFTFLVKKSVIRTILALAGAYVIFQGCSLIFLQIKSMTLRPEPWVNLAWLSISFVCYLGLRFKSLWKSLTRIVHALPHALLVLCGAAWVQRPLGSAVDSMGLILVVILFVLIQNDYYDRKEDDLAGREGKVGHQDVVWTNFFMVLLFLWVLQIYPVLALVMALFFFVGMLYHHPSVRLKERFCLSYKCEGITALLAFLAGTIDRTGFPKDVSLFIPGLLVLGGGTLVSIPKDWKDVESDRKAGIPSYYVVLTKKGRSELIIHRWIVAIVTVCLLVPPISFLVGAGAHWSFFLLGVLGFLPGAALLLVKSRKLAVATFLGALAAYMLVLAAAVGYFRV